MLTVVKIGGAWLKSGAEEGAFRDLAGLRGDLVVVHGGGHEISRWLDRTGIEVEWVEGLRVTRGDSLQLTAMVLSGWVNKRVVEALARAGRPSVGISGGGWRSSLCRPRRCGPPRRCWESEEGRLGADPPPFEWGVHSRCFSHFHWLHRPAAQRKCG